MYRQTVTAQTPKKKELKRTSLETKYNLASNSKPLISLLAIILIKQNRLELNDTIEKFIPDVPSILKKETSFSMTISSK